MVLGIRTEKRIDFDKFWTNFRNFCHSAEQAMVMAYFWQL